MSDETAVHRIGSESRPASLPGIGIPRRSLDHPDRGGEPFHGSDALLEPPTIFGGPILELPVDAEIMGPVMGDVGIELGLPANRDQVGLPVLQNRFRLPRFENDADRHRRNADFVADALGVGDLETEPARDLRCGRRT